MEERLREEFRQIYFKKQNKEITEEEYLEEIKEKVMRLLEKEPKRLIDLCHEHISGLSEEHLLQMARDKTRDFVYMNISAGAYRYSNVSKKSDSSHPDSRKIIKIYRELLTLLGLSKERIDRILKQTGEYEDYDSDPAMTLLEVLMDNDICEDIDWKFAAEDVEYNLNLIAKELNLKPVKEYPPYEEGQPLGYEAVKLVAKESEYAVVGISDGDSIIVFLTPENKAEAVKETLDALAPYWVLEDVYILK